MKILQWIGGLFLPMFKRPRVSPGLIWFLHMLLIAAIAVGLWYVGRKIDITDYLGGRLPWMKPFWLSALFLLVYFIIWQAWWVWRLLQPEAAGSDFPDLDEAWGQIVSSLEKAGIGVGDTPVFLVFGRVAGADEAIFQGVPGGLAVTGGSPSGSPVRAFANRDAIFVTCPGASLLGNPATVQHGPAGGGLDQSIRAGGGGMNLGASIGMDKSIGMGSVGGDIGRVQQLIRAAREQNRSLTDAERAEIRRLSEGGPAATPQAASRPATLMQDPAEVEYRQARLTHLCGLIARTRWPLCPINGAMVYIPVSDCEKEEVAQQIGLIARQDVRTAEDRFRLSFPVYALLGGLEALPGGPEFLAKFAADRKGQRLGKGMPLVPDLPPDAAADQAEKTSLWVFHSLLPFWVFKLFQVERSGEGPAASTRANAELFQFLNSVRQRGSAAARLVGRLAMPGDAGPPRFGGVYLTANAPELGAGPLFVDEFYRKVINSQPYVAWTDAAFADDARYRRMTKAGYIFLGVVVLAVLALAGYVVYDLTRGR
ncbi:MAG TPA: type VI secretion protein IcmF/TssM N-terminal domain-containing protein [Gemmataceae bacterium]|nr:type VI secretion protein IcmF/TssM N-terminal domain-containing protein [Gemmataceae bacterium]